jgi:hypothetical protein
MNDKEAHQCCLNTSQMLWQQMDENDISIRQLSRYSGLSQNTIRKFMTDCSCSTCNTLWKMGAGMEMHSGIFMNVSLDGIECFRLVQNNPCPFGLAGHQYCPYDKNQLLKSIH